MLAPDADVRPARAELAPEVARVVERSGLEQLLGRLTETVVVLRIAMKHGRSLARAVPPPGSPPACSLAAMVRRLRRRGVAASAGVAEGGRVRENVAPREDGSEEVAEAIEAGTNVRRAEQEPFRAAGCRGCLDLGPRHRRRDERPRRRPE